MDLPAFRRTAYRWTCQLLVGLFIGGLASFSQDCLSVGLPAFRRAVYRWTYQLLAGLFIGGPACCWCDFIGGFVRYQSGGCSKW